MFDSNDKLVQKWAPVLEHADVPAIDDAYKTAVTARLLENSEIEFAKEGDANSFGEISETTNVAGGIQTFDPVLISMIRRSMPNLIAYDIAGVQPMTGPTGLIFAMKAKYATQGGTEALFNEADTVFGATAANGKTDQSGSALTAQDADVTGLGTTTGADLDTTDVNATGGGSFLQDILTTAEGEQLGTSGEFSEMAFTIEKVVVSAETRALKAEYTMELAQDLRAVHGLDAEAELSNILSAEALAEINREVVRTIYKQAKIGVAGATHAGIYVFGTDTDGRWADEKYKNLAHTIQLEANVIARDIRRGKGNFVICSSDVASALSAAGNLSYAPAVGTSLTVDDAGNTFAGMMGGMKVYIDPYAGANFACVGYRGTNPYDAGIFYCPYVPLTKVKAVGENTFQPKIGFKTRYGMAANPYAAQSGNRANPYFRIFRIDGLK